MVLEETLESPLDCKKIKPVTPRGNIQKPYNVAGDSKIRNEQEERIIILFIDIPILQKLIKNEAKFKVELLVSKHGRQSHLE